MSKPFKTRFRGFHHVFQSGKQGLWTVPIDKIDSGSIQVSCFRVWTQFLTWCRYSHTSVAENWGQEGQQYHTRRSQQHSTANHKSQEWYQFDWEAIGFKSIRGMCRQNPPTKTITTFKERLSIQEICATYCQQIFRVISTEGFVRVAKNSVLGVRRNAFLQRLQISRSQV